MHMNLPLKDRNFRPIAAFTLHRFMCASICCAAYWSAQLSLTEISNTQIAAASNPSQDSPSTFSRGTSLYESGKFAEALPVFKAISEKESSNANASYYYALCLHRLGKLQAAKSQYKSIATKFAGTIAADHAAKALAVLNGTANSSNASFGEFKLPSPQHSSSSSLSSSGSVDARIYFMRENDSIVVNATVNNRPVKMIFDTGAEICTLGKNHLKELGIPQPSEAPSERSTGIGGRQTTASWKIEADITLGSIRKQQCAISVLEYMEGEPLLGQNFFKDLNYTIENSANCIHFTKRAAAIATPKIGNSNREWNVVPFQKFGDQLVVDAEINGQRCPMVFDTGAQRTSFTHAQLKQLKIAVPSDAELETRVGAGGRITAFSFPIERIKLGPIEKKSVKISAVSAELQYPLLGQNFYGDYEYTVDTAARCIRFNRR